MLAMRCSPVPSLAVSGWDHIQYSMPVEAWAACLSDHPDRAYCDYLLSGLREGFRIGYQRDQMFCRSTLTNMQSAAVWLEVISSFLEAEVQAGRVLGPVEPEAARAVQVNRFGLVPKNHQPGKWRLIIDLSFPRGRSVNDGIELGLGLGTALWTAAVFELLCHSRAPSSASWGRCAV